MLKSITNFSNLKRKATDSIDSQTSKRVTTNESSSTLQNASPVPFDTLNFINILTPENKKNPVFKTELAKLSRSDAHHDLKEVFKDSMYKNDDFVRKAFDSGIPVPATVSYHEGEALAAVILSVNNDGNTILINGNDEKLYEALNSVPDCTAGYNGRYSLFDIGVTGTPIFKYKTVRFVIQCSTNTNFKEEDLSAISCKNDFGKNFVENVKLGEDGNEAAIIVDFSQHHFLEYLTAGIKTDFKIHYLMTPEVVNDPAGKPNVNNKSLFGIQDSGVRLNSYVQTDNQHISYTHFDETDPSPSNNFFSNYDFTLSPIKQIFTEQKVEKLITTLNIKYDVVPGKPLTDTIEDSKDENSVTSVLGYLRRLIDIVRKKNDAGVNFNFNSKIQQKRGGDWFQALCCLDAKNRTITQILPIRGLPTKLLPTCPVYLVTHDRIAVSYALLNGVNVIYIDYYGRIFVFKNTGDKTLESSGKPIEQILFEGIKTKWTQIEPTTEGLSTLLTTAKKYNSDRQAYLNGDSRDQKRGKLYQFYTKCDEIKKSVDAFTFNDIKSIANFQKIVTSSVREMFTMAVELEFIKTNLVDVENDIAFIESHKHIFQGEYTETIKTTVADFSKALSNIKGLQDRFGIIPANGNFYNAFDNWIIKNVPKLDVYKCAKKLLDEFIRNTDDRPFDFNRLTTFYVTSPEHVRTTDSHIFLPFIHGLDDTSRDKMLSILYSLTNKLKDYNNKNLETRSYFSLRRNSLSSTTLFSNSLANLIYESFIFIERSKAITPENINPIFERTKELIIHSISTDNILLTVDKKELDVLKEPGKNTNYTEDDQDVVTVGGGYLDAFSNDSEYAKKSESVICDMSVKQIIWPLLTSVLLQNNNKASINNFVQQIKKNIPDVIKSDEEADVELKNNPIIIGLINKLSSISDSIPGSLGGRRRRGGGFSQETYKAIIELNNLANELYSSQYKTSTSQNLMRDFKLGFHPLTPIYAMLTSYYNTLGPQSSSDPFFYTYFTYINVLEKMKLILETNYLNNTSNPYKTGAAYLIGMGLCYMLLKSHTSKAQNNEILDVIGMNKKDFSTFSLKNDSFTSVFSGAFHQDTDEEMIGMICLNNKLFNNFINNQVNIKQLLEQGTSVVNLPNYEVLKDGIFKMMGEIVVKVNADRGTHITSLASESTSGIPGISHELQAERITRLEQGQQKYEENLAKGLIKPQRITGIKYGSDVFTYSPTEDQSNMVTSTTSSQGSRSKGGKKRKNTKKRRNGNRNKTVKRYNKHKRTRKHKRR